MNNNLKVVLSQKAIQYIYEYGQPIANYQFVGYVFPASDKMNGVLDLNGNWGFCSCQNKKGKIKILNERQVLRQIKKWLKIGFLTMVEDSPFPEFEYYTNIDIDMSKVYYIEGKLFDDEFDGGSGKIWQ